MVLWSSSDCHSCPYSTPFYGPLVNKEGSERKVNVNFIRIFVVLQVFVIESETHIMLPIIYHHFFVMIFVESTLEAILCGFVLVSE